MKNRIILPIVFITFLSIISCTKKVVEVRYAPVVYDLAVPDSIERGAPVVYFMSATVYDPDGAGDIDSVYFVSTKPDGSSNGNHFGMRDDGQPPDSVAGDGIYSQGIQAGDSNSQLGNYTFTFHARDKNGNESNHPQAIVTMY
jgi:hypothetical protein